MDATNFLLHKRASVDPLEWTGVEGSFYIDGCLNQKLIVPRAEIAAGKNLYDDVERSNGWTSWGNVYVESVSDDEIVTTAGTLSKYNNIYIEKSNVMPYADGEAKLRLIYDLARITVPAFGDKPERVFYMNPDDFALSTLGKLSGYKKVLEALEAQLPNEADLIEPYKQIVKQLEESKEWKELVWEQDVWETELGDHVRIEAHIPFDVFRRIFMDYDDEYYFVVHPCTPHCEATVWNMYNVDADGNLTPHEFKPSERNILSKAVPYLYFKEPKAKEMLVDIGSSYEWEGETEVMLNSGMPHTVTKKPKYGKQTLTLTLRPQP